MVNICNVKLCTYCCVSSRFSFLKRQCAAVKTQMSDKRDPPHSFNLTLSAPIMYKTHGYWCGEISMPFWIAEQILKTHKILTKIFLDKLVILSQEKTLLLRQGLFCFYSKQISPQAVSSVQEQESNCMMTHSKAFVVKYMHLFQLMIIHKSYKIASGAVF